MGLGLRQRYLRFVDCHLFERLYTDSLSAFAAFFTVFEITRRSSSHLKRNTQELCNNSQLSAEKKRNIPKVVNAVSLVTGGVCYSFILKDGC